MKAIFAFALLCISLVGNAQTYPSRPVTFIVPWPPGGSTDLSMRAIATIAEKHLGGRIVIENKPGVSGTMGAQALAGGAKPDGYTISQMPITVFRLPHMTKMAFDPAQRRHDSVDLWPPGVRHDRELHVPFRKLQQHTFLAGSLIATLQKLS